MTLLLPAVTVPQSAWTGDNPIFQGTSRSHTPSRSSSHRLLDHSKVKIWKYAVQHLMYLLCSRCSRHHIRIEICQTNNNMPRGAGCQLLPERCPKVQPEFNLFGNQWVIGRGLQSNGPQHTVRAVHHEPSNYYCVELHKHYLSNIYCIVEPHEPM